MASAHKSARKTPDVFLSHAQEDRAHASWLAAELERFGYDCFVASDDINAMLGTQSWSEAIDALLVHVPVIIVLVTESSLRSKWVEYEWRSFHEDVLGERRSGLLVPVLWERHAIGELPVALRHWQVVDLTDTAREAGLVALRELLDGFRSATQGSSQPLDRALPWSSPSSGTAQSSSLEPSSTHAAGPIEPARRRPRWLGIGALAAVLLGTVLAAVPALRARGPSPDAAPATPSLAPSGSASATGSASASASAATQVDPLVEPRAGWEPIELLTHPLLDREAFVTRAETWRDAHAAFQAACERGCTARQAAAGHFCQGEYARIEGRSDAARSEFGLATSSDPSWALPLLGVSMTVLPTDPQQALQYARDAYEKDSTLWVALLAKGAAFAWMGQYVAALEELLEARRMAPPDCVPRVDAKLAITYHSEGLRDQRAKQLARTACNDQVRVSPACTVLAEQALETDNPHEALRYVELADHDDFAPLMLAAGDAYQKLGKMDLAWLAWKRATAAGAQALSQGAPPERLAAVVQAVKMGVPPAVRESLRSRSEAGAPPVAAPAERSRPDPLGAGL
jgi:tetratricopeptide (TPR) repeat protein